MSVTGAIDAGLEFLLARQSPQGFWTDWRLPPGESRVWTTAYVGYRLSAVRGGDPDRLRAALRKAADWLAAHEFAGGGWGYAEHVGPDADTTAMATLFLASQGVSISPKADERLRAFQRDDGGFATFAPGQSFGAWVVSHPDVSATAVAALLASGLRPDPNPHIERGIAYCLRQRTPAGLWNSFWWESCLYATEANLSMLRRADADHDGRTTLDALSLIRPKNCFEHALLLLCLLHAGAAAEALHSGKEVAALRAAQSEDGSWPSAPILRLTDRACGEPWAQEDAGPLFADENRIFTTATAVASLAAVAEHTAQGSGRAAVRQP